VNLKSSFFTPRSIGRANPPMVLPHPNGPEVLAGRLPNPREPFF
jgi:hypothetical protein